MTNRWAVRTEIWTLQIQRVELQDEVDRAALELFIFEHLQLDVLGRHVTGRMILRSYGNIAGIHGDP